MILCSCKRTLLTLVRKQLAVMLAPLWSPTNSPERPKGIQSVRINMNCGDAWGAMVQLDSCIHIRTSYWASPKPLWASRFHDLSGLSVSLNLLEAKLNMSTFASCPVHSRHKSNPGTATEERPLLVVGSGVGNSSLAPAPPWRWCKYLTSNDDLINNKRLSYATLIRSNMIKSIQVIDSDSVNH